MYPAQVPSPSMGTAGITVSASSPRRPTFPAPGPSSPRVPRTSTPSRLPSISSNQPLDFVYPDSPNGSGNRPTNVVTGFNLSPSIGQTTLPSGGSFLTGSPSMSSNSLLSLNTSSAAYRKARLSPQLTTPVEQTFQYAFPPEQSSPRPLAASPRGLAGFGDLPPRSRRNSAAIVSISLSSRSRSRTPRGTASALPAGAAPPSGQGTPNKSSKANTPRGDDSGQGIGKSGREVTVQMMDWAPSPPGLEEMDDWSPAGGMLLHEDEGDHDSGVIEDDLVEGLAYDEEDIKKTWSGESDSSRVVEDVLKPGMIFGEGLEFQGEEIVPAVGRLTIDDNGDEVGMPLRRGGSEAGVGRGAGGVGVRDNMNSKKSYEVIRQLGSGSYAVVYLVKERGGRKREYALKCLSKQDLAEENLETQLFEATIHLSLPIHTNIVTLHQTLQTKKWLFLMLELCPGEDLFYWLEKSRDASPPTIAAQLYEERSALLLSSSKMSSSSIPFSSSQMFPSITGPLSNSFSHSPSAAFSPNYSASPASLLFAHHNGSHGYHMTPSQTPPTPSLLSSFSANTLLTSRRLRLIASMFSQMCEAVAVCHDAGVSHRDIKPENFICCDSVELEGGVEGDEEDYPVDFGPQAKRKVVVKLTDFGLATTEEESGDVECGSKPYMSYECRNNLGPTYLPAPADVWSLGIVLINMLFHRNPWKDPTPGDPNFDNFLSDPVGFLLTKFTGIGKEVAGYLADHVLCIDVEARTSARELGNWIKGLPDMIGGRRAIQALKVARLETKNIHSHSTAVPPSDSGLFVKSPVDLKGNERKASWTSALTSSAPLIAGLSTLPPPSQLIDRASALPTPDLDRDELRSASTVDEQPTPVDRSQFVSPETFDENDDMRSRIGTDAGDNDAECRSLSTTKRRKRGVRKGKAAQAALAAAASSTGKPTQEERDALLAELAQASQTLARDLSKVSSPVFDPNRIEDFPPLGTTPAQIAAAKKSKWKDLMKLSHGNPELAALARRVSERDDASGGNWSAPAKLQAGSGGVGGGYTGGYSKPGLKQTTTASSGFSSALSSFGPVSSATTSSSKGADDDDWRKPALRSSNANIVSLDEERVLGREQGGLPGGGRGKNESTSRARQAALAAAAITGSFDTMGQFGKRPDYSSIGGPPLKAHVGGIASSKNTSRAAVPINPTRPPHRSNLSHSSRPLGPIIDEHDSDLHLSSPTRDTHFKSHYDQSYPDDGSNLSTSPSRPSLSSAESSSTITMTSATVSTGFTASGLNGPSQSPNKPKLKGQIQSLAKMLSGLKTKGKD